MNTWVPFEEYWPQISVSYLSTVLLDLLIDSFNYKKIAIKVIRVWCSLVSLDFSQARMLKDKCAASIRNNGSLVGVFLLYQELWKLLFIYSF